MLNVGIDGKVTLEGRPLHHKYGIGLGIIIIHAADITKVSGSLTIGIDIVYSLTGEMRELVVANSSREFVQPVQTSLSAYPQVIVMIFADRKDIVMEQNSWFAEA